MRKFEQISSLDHQMSLAGGLGPGSCTGWGQSWGPYREVGLYSEVQASWVMITCGHRMIDRHR